MLYRRNTPADGSIIFTAAAGNADTYLDGDYPGSVIGIINSAGQLHIIKTIDRVVKLEGLEANIIDDKVKLLLVTDADDDKAPAQIYATEFSGYPFI